MTTTYADPWPAPRAHGPVEASVSLPGSKSLTNRALVLASIADGPSVVRRALRSRDTSLMATALTSLGAHVDTTGDDWAVTPGAFDRDAVVDCGLAGTVLRFVPPVAALSSGSVAFDGDPHMRTRPVGEVLTALRGLGVTVDDDGRGAAGAPEGNGLTGMRERVAALGGALTADNVPGGFRVRATIPVAA